jgi:hypothetical protein
MASARVILPLLTFRSFGFELRLRNGRQPTKASKQIQLQRPVKKNTLPSSRHRREHNFWSQAFPRCLSDNYVLAVYGTGETNLRGCNRGIFSLGGKLTSRFRTGAALAIVVTRDLRFITGASVCLAARWERRSMRRGENAHVPCLHRQTKQRGRNLCRLRSSASSLDRPTSAERYHRP